MYVGTFYINWRLLREYYLQTGDIPINWRRRLVAKCHFVARVGLVGCGLEFLGCRHTDQPPLTHIIRTTHLKFFGHITLADSFMDHSQVLISSVAPLPRDWIWTTDQADLVKLGSAQLNLMLLHSTLVWQLPIIEHNIDRHEGRLWERQRPLDQPHDDDDDDDEVEVRVRVSFWLYVIFEVTRGMPYSSALYYANLPSLQQRRDHQARNFFTSILVPDSCLHSLLPAPRDKTLTSRLRAARKFPPCLSNKTLPVLHKFWLTPLSANSVTL